MSHKVKIIFDVPESIFGPLTETLWAEGAEEGYLVLNSPFYAFGVSYLDTVTAVATAEVGIMKFLGKAFSSGHSTYRLMVTDEANWRSAWNALQALGCGYEEVRNEDYRLLSVDVPPDTDIHAVYAVMQQGEIAGTWDFQEGDVNHPSVTDR